LILDEIKEGKDEYTLKAVGVLNIMEKFSAYYGLQCPPATQVIILSTLSNVMNSVELFKGLFRESFYKFLEACWQQVT